VTASGSIWSLIDYDRRDGHRLTTHIAVDPGVRLSSRAANRTRHPLFFPYPRHHREPIRH